MNRSAPLVRNNTAVLTVVKIIVVVLVCLLVVIVTLRPDAARSGANVARNARGRFTDPPVPVKPIDIYEKYIRDTTTFKKPDVSVIIPLRNEMLTLTHIDRESALCGNTNLTVEVIYSLTGKTGMPNFTETLNATLRQIQTRASLLSRDVEEESEAETPNLAEAADSATGLLKSLSVVHHQLVYGATTKQRLARCVRQVRFLVATPKDGMSVPYARLVQVALNTLSEHSAPFVLVMSEWLQPITTKEANVTGSNTHSRWEAAAGGASHSSNQRNGSSESFLDRMVRPMDFDNVTAVLCTVLQQATPTSLLSTEPLPYHIVDRGFDISMANDNIREKIYVLRRMYGYAPNDGRVELTQSALLASPYCLLVDRVRLQLAGGFVTNENAALVDRLLAGDNVDGSLEAMLITLKARITHLEDVMQSVSNGDLRREKGLNALLRAGVTAVVEGTRKWEEHSEQKYERKILQASSIATAIRQHEANEIARGERSLQSQVQRVEFATQRCVQMTARLESGHFRANVIPSEEHVGWDLSLRLWQDSKFLSSTIVASSAFVRISAPDMPQLLKKYLLEHEGTLAPPSYTIAGEFANRWGAQLRQILAGQPLVPLANDRQLRVYWSSYCCECCGFSSEIVHLLFPLSRRRPVYQFNDVSCFCRGYPDVVKDTIARSRITPQRYADHKSSPSDVSVYISHREPTAFAFDQNLQRAPPDYHVARSMFEFSRIPHSWVKVLASPSVHEVWVPSTFVYKSFRASGVSPEKLTIVPEALDPFYFDPRMHEPLTLPLSRSRPNWKHWCNYDVAEESLERRFRFFSSFKWEPRKGWELLLEAYVNAFSGRDDVSLYILTSYFVNGPQVASIDPHQFERIVREMEVFVRKRKLLSAAQLQNTSTNSVLKDPAFPHVCIVTEQLAEYDVAVLYRTMDAFVLPTRGEGWGLPLIQAMSMAMPTIGTNWGGNTDFMTSRNSFLIRVDGLEEVPQDSMYAPSPGTKWALPSLNHTQHWLQYVFTNRDHARKVGLRARASVLRHYSEEVIVEAVDARLQQIDAILTARPQKK